MTDLYVTHLLLQHVEDLRRTGEARAAVQRALRERREALALQRGARGARVVLGLPVAPVVSIAPGASATCAGGGAAGQAPASCCAAGA